MGQKRNTLDRIEKSYVLHREDKDLYQDSMWSNTSVYIGLDLEYVFLIVNSIVPSNHKGAGREILP